MTTYLIAIHEKGVCVRHLTRDAAIAAYPYIQDVVFYAVLEAGGKYEVQYKRPLIHTNKHIATITRISKAGAEAVKGLL